MVQEADQRVRVEETNISPQRGDDGCIPAGDKCSDHQEDDFSELLINFIRTVRRKVCVLSKKKDAVLKKNDLVSAILEGQKCLADEGKTPSATKSKELLVYRRKMFRGAKNKGDGCNPTSSLKTSVEPETIQGASVDNLGPARVVQVADIPVSTQLPPKKHKQFGLNHGLHGIARKEHMLIRRERQKALVALRRRGMEMRRQRMVPLRKPTTPLLTSMPPVTTHKLPPFGSYSQQPTIGIGPIGTSYTPHLLFPNGPLGGDTWTEDELDALWMGVRRHGEGYWGSIMKDPTLHFSCYKKPEHLFERWNVEKVRALGVEHIHEPRRHPERQLTGEAPPRASTHIERSSYRKEKIAAGYLKKQTLMLGGTFSLADAIMNEFKGKGKEEASSEGTISD